MIGEIDYEQLDDINQFVGISDQGLGNDLLVAVGASGVNSPITATAGFAKMPRMDPIRTDSVP